MIFEDILLATIFTTEGLRTGAGIAAIDEDALPRPRRSLPKGKLAIAHFPDIDRSVYRVFTPLELSKILKRLGWPKQTRKGFIDDMKQHKTPSSEHVFAFLDETQQTGFLLLHGQLLDWFVIPVYTDGMLGDVDRSALVAFWLELMFAPVKSLKRHPALLHGAGIPWMTDNITELENPMPATRLSGGFSKVHTTSLHWRWDRTDPYHRHGHGGWVLRLTMRKPESYNPHQMGSHPLRALSKPMATKSEAALDSGLFWYINSFDDTRAWHSGWPMMIEEISEKAGEIVDVLPFEMMQALDVDTPALWPEDKIRAYLSKIDQNS